MGVRSIAKTKQEITKSRRGQAKPGRSISRVDNDPSETLCCSVHQSTHRPHTRCSIYSGGDLHINERRLTPSWAISSTPILLITHAYLQGSSAYWLLTADCNLALSSAPILLPAVLILTVSLDPHAGSPAWPTGLAIVISDLLTSRELSPTVSDCRWKRACRVSASCGVGVL